MKKLSGRERNIFIVTVALLLVYVLLQFGIKPIQARREFLGQTISVNEKKLRKNLLIIQRGADVDSQYEELFEALRQKESDEAEVSSMVSNIELIARQLDVHIANLKPKRMRKSNLRKYFSVDLTINGELEPVMHFLYQLQVEPNHLDIDEMVLEKYSSSSSKLKGRLTLSRVRFDPGE